MCGPGRADPYSNLHTRSGRDAPVVRLGRWSLYTAHIPFLAPQKIFNIRELMIKSLFVFFLFLAQLKDNVY
jgi:hypothetical protein